MDAVLKGKKIAIIGGCSPCRAILEILLGAHRETAGISVLGMADEDPNCEGMLYAREHGVMTTTDYNRIIGIDGLDAIVTLKSDPQIADVLLRLKPPHVKLVEMDQFQVMSFITRLKTEYERLKAEKALQSRVADEAHIREVLVTFSDRVTQIAEQSIEKLQSESQSLVESEKELSQIIHGSMIPTFVINKDHIITHWNKALEELTGYKSFELIGTDKQWVPFRSAKRPTMADVIIGEMSEAQIQRYYGNSWRKSALIKEAYEAEEFFPHLGKDGKWIFFTAAPIKSHEGAVVGAIETLIDKTEAKKIQEELQLQDREIALLYEKYKNSEEKYRSLFNNNPNPIFIIDKSTLEILDINNRVSDDYGYTRNELIGKPYLGIGDKDDEPVGRRFKELKDGCSLLFTKRRHHRKGGKSFFVNVKVCTARYSHRDVLIASATDITESVEKETQLIQAGKLATLGTMAAGMAHEINQPLNVIQICADLMLKMVKKGMTIPEDEIVAMANDIISNVARAAGVIKHVRDFARQSERNLKKLSINDPINDVFKVLGHQLINHQINVKLELDPDIPEIRAEHNRLEQVFINLVTNAIDSMDEKAAKAAGQSVEKCLTIRSFSEGQMVVVTVSDTGVGMTPEVKEKIFEPFFTTKETGRGTGLGTSISFGIIKDYSGTIEIESEYGNGATFIIRFPIIR
ncbi:MAG: PAS domain S-box protein [Pseudomonadota bacterium]